MKRVAGSSPMARMPLTGRLLLVARMSTVTSGTVTTVLTATPAKARASAPGVSRSGVLRTP